MEPLISRWKIIIPSIIYFLFTLYIVAFFYVWVGAFDPKRNRNLDVKRILHWRSYNIEEGKIGWKTFMKESIKDYNDFKFYGKGIVYYAYADSLLTLLASIRILRRRGCKLPIEVWYHPNELKPSEIEMIFRLADYIYVRNLLKDSQIISSATSSSSSSLSVLLFHKSNHRIDPCLRYSV